VSLSRHLFEVDVGLLSPELLEDPPHLANGEPVPQSEKGYAFFFVNCSGLALARLIFWDLQLLCASVIH